MEAARRAGINVSRIYTSIFVLCSTLAAVGGILAAARLAAANQSSGTGDVNLNAIAAAVIGGTSLFGGRGTAFSALLGILVIQSISSGLTLLNLDSSFRFMVTGAGAAAGREPRRSGAPHPNLARPRLMQGAGMTHSDLGPGYRQRALARMRSERFDLVVVGGGVTGCGIALDAATRGLSVALVEMRDYAAGTSSRSGQADPRRPALHGAPAVRRWSGSR